MMWFPMESCRIVYPIGLKRFCIYSLMPIKVISHITFNPELWAFKILVLHQLIKLHLYNLASDLFSRVICFSFIGWKAGNYEVRYFKTYQIVKFVQFWRCCHQTPVLNECKNYFMISELRKNSKIFGIWIGFTLYINVPLCSNISSFQLV